MAIEKARRWEDVADKKARKARERLEQQAMGVRKEQPQVGKEGREIAEKEAQEKVSP